MIFGHFIILYHNSLSVATKIRKNFDLFPLPGNAFVSHGSFPKSRKISAWHIAQKSQNRLYKSAVI